LTTTFHPSTDATAATQIRSQTCNARFTIPHIRRDFNVFFADKLYHCCCFGQEQESLPLLEFALTQYLNLGSIEASHHEAEL
jgi:hypothetical protein